jgi:hypothetical protein
LAESLLGGSIALFYLVSFAGYIHYGLFSHPVSFALATATTALACFLAVRRKSVCMAVIGIVGGLSTPLLLWSPNPTSADHLYLAVVMLGAGYLYIRLQGFSILLVLMILGEVAIYSALDMGSRSRSGDLVALSLSYWLAVVGSRLILTGQHKLNAKKAADEAQLIGTRAILFFATIFACANLNDQFGWTAITLGWTFLFLAAMFWIGTLLTSRIRQIQIPLLDVGCTWFVLGLWLLTNRNLGGAFPTNIPYILDRDWWLVMMAAFRLALLMVIRKSDWTHLRAVLFLSGGFAVVVFANQCLFAKLLPSGLHDGSLLRLTALGIVSAGYYVDRGPSRWFHAALAYFGMMAWLWVELHDREQGAGLVTIAWAVLGCGLIAWSLLKSSAGLKVAGLLTLTLVGGKLLVFDLTGLDAVWRILMFLGYGLALLGIAYLLHRPRGNVSIPKGNQQSPLPESG